MDKATRQRVLRDVQSALLCGLVVALVAIGWDAPEHPDVPAAPATQATAVAPTAPRPTPPAPAPSDPADDRPEQPTRAPGSREFLLDESDRLLLEDYGHLHHDFVRGIRAAEARGWFAPSEQADFELAQQALVRLRAHVERLESDPEFPSGMNLLGNVALRSDYRDADMVWHWASPFLVCYPRIRGDSPFDALESRDRQQRERRAAARSAAVEHAAWRGRIAQAVYQQFLADWQEPLGLKPLMDPYGGREDYPQGVRSYRNGYPMTILCFGAEGSIALPRHHLPVRELYGSRRSEGIVDRDSGDLYCFERGEEDRLADARFAAQSVVPVLAFSFARQRRNWGLPPTADTLVRGLPVLYRIASIDDGVPSFVPIGEPSADPLEMACLVAAREPKSANSPGRMSLANLIERNARGESRFEPQSLSESRAWVLFFMHGEEGRHRAAFAKALQAMLERPRHDEGRGGPMLREAFGLHSPADWQRLENAFDAFLDARLGVPGGEAAQPPDDFAAK